MASSLSAEAKKFLKNQEVAVLSTISSDNQVQAAAIYYLYGPKDNLYILTKSGTSKARNMLANPQVAITIYDAEQLKTIQIQGHARIEDDLKIKHWLFDFLGGPRDYKGGKQMPPLTELDAGNYIAFRIEPSVSHYSNYKSNNTLVPSHNNNATKSAI